MGRVHACWVVAGVHNFQTVHKLSTAQEKTDAVSVVHPAFVPDEAIAIDSAERLPFPAVIRVTHLDLAPKPIFNRNGLLLGRAFS